MQLTTNILSRWRYFQKILISLLTSQRCLNEVVSAQRIRWIIFDCRQSLSFFWITWWRHQMGTFSALPALCAENPHKGLWRGALIFSLKCVWINSWVNNRGAGDLRRHRAHYDVSVMIFHYRTVSPAGMCLAPLTPSPFSKSVNVIHKTYIHTHSLTNGHPVQNFVNIQYVNTFATILYIKYKMWKFL